MGEDSSANQSAFYEQRIKQNLGYSSSATPSAAGPKSDDELLLNIRILKEIECFKMMQTTQDQLVKLIFLEHDEYKDFSLAEEGRMSKDGDLSDFMEYLMKLA